MYIQCIKQTKVTIIGPTDEDIQYIVDDTYERFIAIITGLALTAQMGFKVDAVKILRDKYKISLLEAKLTIESQMKTNVSNGVRTPK